MITSHFFGGSLGITISPSTNRYFDEINFHGQCERHAPRINPADIVVTLTRGRLVWISSLHLATFMDSPDLGAFFFHSIHFLAWKVIGNWESNYPIGTPWLFNNLRKPWPMKIDDYMAVCQNLVPLVNIKIAGKWMFILLKMVLYNRYWSIPI